MSISNEIITSIVNGDRHAFKRLYELLNEKVYNTALSYTQNEKDAEEITQDVFLKIHKNAASFKGQAQISTWVYRITVNTSLNYIKKRKRSAFLRFEGMLKEKPDFDHPGVLLENKENARMLFKVINNLPEKQKTAFILSYIEHLPRKEVANIMDITLKAVESLLQRAKGNLRKSLEKMYPNRRKNK